MLAARAAGVPVIDGLHDAPDFAIAPAAHLLAALASQYPKKSIVLAVVDPGVGGRRDAIVARIDGRGYVAPDNGLLSVLWQRARRRECWRVTWRPARLSASFHGRDLFAPVAAALARNRVPRSWLAKKEGPGVLLDPRELAEVIYIDHYGNAVTGLRAARLSTEAKFLVGKRVLSHARSFEDASGPFWYENSMGLVEIACPRGSAARRLGVAVGSRISVKKAR